MLTCLFFCRLWVMLLLMVLVLLHLAGQLNLLPLARWNWRWNWRTWKKIGMRNLRSNILIRNFLRIWWSAGVNCFNLMFLNYFHRLFMLRLLLRLLLQVFLLIMELMLLILLLKHLLLPSALPLLMLMWSVVLPETRRFWKLLRRKRFEDVALF